MYRNSCPSHLRTNKVPSLILVSLICGEFCSRYWNAFPSWFRTLTKLFVTCKESKNIFFRCTSGSFLMSFCPGWNFSHLYHSFTQQWQSFVPQSHSHKKQQNLVKSSCMPTRRNMTLKSPQVFHKCMLYCIQLRRSFIFSYNSFIWAAWKHGLKEIHILHKENTFQACVRCISEHHSSPSQSCPKNFSTPSTSLQ